MTAPKKKKLKGYSREYFDRKVAAWEGKRALLQTWALHAPAPALRTYVSQLKERVTRLRETAGM